MNPQPFETSNRERRSPPEPVGARAWGAVLALLAALALVAAPPLAAQQTGTVTGRVVEGATQAPVSSAQVYLQGTSIGTLTGENGRFLILNVDAGQHTLVVERIGYQTVTQAISVQAGQSTTVNVEMEQEVLGLDELVVTGEAGSARRREIGNTIAQINLNDIEEPVTSMESLLQGRAAGLTITSEGGSSGSSSQIRLRGNVSVSQSNQPLIYIDGVRMRSDPYPKNAPPVGYSGRSANVSASPLNDIDPASIERIEIIKGAAATTLYGTEASAGVIQIFTKRGTRGDAQWTAQVDQGFNWLKKFGPDTAPFMRLDPWLRGAPSIFGGGISDAWKRQYQPGGSPVGPAFDKDYQGVAWRQKYYLSARGGLENMNYFVSGSWEDNEGIFPEDREEKMNLRGNFTFTPLEDLTIQWNTGLTLDHISNTPSGNNAHGLTLQAYRFNQNYVGGYLPDRIDEIVNDYDIESNIGHVITGMTFNYQPTEAISNRLSVGYDRAEWEGRQVRPFGFRLAPNGIMANEKWTNETVTVDYAGSYNRDLTSEISSTFSLGGQVIETEEKSVDGYSETFPGPIKPTLSSGALTLSFEDRIRVINAGFFGQARFGWRDRVFITGGVRFDGNSAFGEDLGLEAYPKVSASWVIADEEWWPENMGNVKLRGALGQSGRAPGAFDAVKTWSTEDALGDQPAFLPENLGNPELGPERTTEWEVGFDGTFIDDRLTAEFTYYHQRTKDALLEVTSTPSLGDWDDQLQNVGELTNQGIELYLNAVAYQSRDFSAEVGMAVSTNKSEMVDLGGAPDFTVGGNMWIMEGEPVPVAVGERVTNPNEVAAPIVETDVALGPNQPTHIITPSVRFRFLDGWSLSARGEYQGGHYVYEGGTANAIGRGVIWPYCDTGALPEGGGLAPNASERMADGDFDGMTARTRFLCNWDETDDERYIYPANFFKLRDITLQVPLEAVVPWGSSPTLTLSAKNAVRWFNDDWFAFDPEMLANGDSDVAGTDQLERAITEHVPPPSTFTASLRINF